MNNTTKLSILFKQSPISSIYFNQIRTSFTNKYMHGPTKASNPDPPYKEWAIEFLKGGYKTYIIEESKRIYKKFTRSTLIVPKEENKTYIFEDFNSDESLKKWKAQADSAFGNGFSQATLTRSRFGHALFKGYLDTTCPDDGLTQMSGFAAMIGTRKPRDRLFSRWGEYWDWEKFNCFEIKFRGDGRKYTIVLNTASDDSDLTWYDNYFYPLYTRGGQHWQTLRIPFSKFIFSYKGLIQDGQTPLPKYNIKFVSIALNDRISGPFSLEIDYMGLRNQTFAFTDVQPYEKYYVPHLKYRPIGVDCDAPEN